MSFYWINRVLDVFYKQSEQPNKNPRETTSGLQDAPSPCSVNRYFLKTNRSWRSLVRDLVSIYLPQSRINSAVTAPDKAWFNKLIHTSKLRNTQPPPKQSVLVPDHYKAFFPKIWTKSHLFLAHYFLPLCSQFVHLIFPLPQPFFFLQ